VVGKVGADLSVDEGKAAAQYCALNLCSTLKSNLGDLDRVKGIVKVLAFVNCTDGFAQQPQVVNGCSEALVQIFGVEKGSHARSAVGTNSLPLNVAVEVEVIVELHP
jgi:enamine deaminase RidA (YjgF/YER057c/UK114 family)